MRRALTLLAGAALAAAALAAVGSGASFTHASQARVAVRADALANYARLWSQATDPAGAGGYALRAGAVPATPAASGSDDTLALDLGHWFNTTGSAARAFVVQAPDPLPAGVAAVEVTLTLQPDPGGRQPLTAARLAPLTGGAGAATATLSAGERRQVDLDVDTRRVPGQGVYTPTVTVTARHAAYAGDFLATAVPVRVADQRP